MNFINDFTNDEDHKRSDFGVVKRALDRRMKRISFWLIALLLPLLSACTKAQQPLLEKIDTLTVPYAINSMAWHPNGQWLAIGYFMQDEVEVWDVKTKTSVLKVPRKRSTQNPSGQETLFSADGKYLVVQDFLDTKNGDPKFPSAYDDPSEILAQQDKDRYLFARVWDVALRKEIAQIKGPGSRLYGAGQNGFCQSPALPGLIAIHRQSVVTMYEISTGKFVGEVNARYPFADKPEQRRGYWKMSCNPTRAEVALEGAQFFKEAPIFGFPESSGATPIVVVDLERIAVKKVLFSATPLNGVAYTADGSKLISFGMSPTRVWDANKDFQFIGEIKNPPKMDWVQSQTVPVDALNPPKDAPGGNAGDLIAIPGTHLMIGVATSLHVWDTTQLNIAANAPAPIETFRLAVHAPENTLALAERNLVHFYRFNTVMTRTSKGN